MKIDLDKQALIKHAIAIAIFLVVFVILFHPALLGGKSLARHDIQQWRASAQAITEFRDRTGEEPLWTNFMFSGMPATLVSTLYSGDLIDPIFRALNFYSPYSLLLISCVCFYLLMVSFKVDSLIAVIGAICYSYSSYVLIGLAAGHSSRIAALAFLPLVVAGVNLVFQGKYRWGFIATALGLALEIKVNHLQITYYLVLILLAFGISHLVGKIKSKDRELWVRQIPILLIAVILAVGVNFGRLWNIADYGKYSTRGASELTSESAGLEKSYIFEFSNGIAEPMVLFIPNFMGGASQEELGPKSNLAEALRSNGVPRNQVNQYIKSAPTYWGNQRLTAPYYVGAIAVFLAVLGVIVLDRDKKIWLLVVIGLGIMLSWGDNFKAFNYFMFEYFPGYNKFRAVTFTLLMSIFGISVLASLGLNHLLKTDKPKIKPLLWAILFTAGFAIVLAMFAGIGRYAGAVDDNLIAQQTPQWFIDAIRADRASLLRKDALRSAMFILFAGMMVYLIIKEKISKKIGILTIVSLTILDVVLVDKRYLNSEKFVNENNTEVVKTPADDYILRQASSGERVLNLLNPFNDAITSYHHESIGGYHGAKLRRYMDLIEYHLTPEIQELISRIQSGSRTTEGLEVLNMLNTRFFKFGNDPGQVITNTNHNGNAWFVNDLIKVNSAQEEIDAMQNFSSKTTAVVDVSKFEALANFTPSTSQATITLSARDMNSATYDYASDGEGLIVFSEVYFPKGWKGQIDGNESEIVRANYVLRAMKVPAGKHTITFSYEPSLYTSGNRIMLVFGIFLLIGCIGVAILPLIQRKKVAA